MRCPNTPNIYMCIEPHAVGMICGSRTSISKTSYQNSGGCVGNWGGGPQNLSSSKEGVVGSGSDAKKTG